MKFLPEKSLLESGQALLIVLLAMSVVLTVVLSVVSRSVTDISITTFEEESQRAFDAAEAGIEETLLTGVAPGAPVPVGDASFQVVQNFPIPANDQFKYPTDLLSGESATFWFVSQDSNGNLICGSQPCFKGPKAEIYWGKPGSLEIPAVEVSVFYDTSFGAVSSPNDLSQVKVARYALDPDPVRAAKNKFDPANVCGGSCYTIGGQEFLYSSGNNINLVYKLGGGCTNSPGCILMIKVRMFYNSSEPQPIGIDLPNNSDLPSQGKVIESTGTAGESSRKVEVFQSYPETPFVFDAAIFSPGGLVHN